ncbi:MAG TPA: hypothetical protein VNO18_18225 [Xanthobacteraceae bacterium]|jgi:hypothetical protein|nr:hypothetical protein [Xanthobacteraceae bacterium]
MTKDNFSVLFQLLGMFTPGWAAAVLILCIVAYRSPSIIKEVFTGIREHAKVKAEIAQKQRKTEQEIADKREQAQRRSKKAPKP